MNPNEAAPHVVVSSTGGTMAARTADAGTTIGDRIDPDGPGLAPELLAALVPVARVTLDPYCRVPSTEMGQLQLLDLARRIAAHLADPATDGMVVTHGTDTLEGTALCLELTLPGPKPVVVTGPMRPSGAIGADGGRNLLNAVRIAAAPGAVGHGVLVTMDDRIMAAAGAT
jgi:L-asparaginase